MIIAGDHQWCSIVYWPSVPGTPNYATGVVVRNPKHGEATVRIGTRGPTFWYRSAEGYFGSDSFEVEYGPQGGRRTINVEIEPKPTTQATR